MVPSYSLKEWQSAVQGGNYRIAVRALSDATLLGFDDENILDCCLKLDESHFYKTMPAEKAPGLWQDVYKITYQGVRLYVKIQMSFGGNAVIISFKEDTSW